MPLVDYTAIVRRRGGGTRCSLKRKGMRMHLGGIGKGYAVDHAVTILRDRGFRNFMIQAGGDLYVGGLQRRQAVAAGDRRSRAARRPQLRHARPVATARSARQATTSASSSRTASATTTSSIRPPASRRAAAAASRSSRTARSWPTVCRQASSSSVPREGMALVERLPGRRRGHRHRHQRGAGVERAEGEISSYGSRRPTHPDTRDSGASKAGGVAPRLIVRDERR